MYLKSLEIKGFKSFADRCVLSFEPGISAIVGPNGSGKSNISDAVLWVLGERNAKQLRGSQMDDLIFSGSGSRRSVNLCQVNLVLDNSDGKLPVDFSEVVISRRLYRSGESQYLLNGSLVRRRDILEVLHDTGMGSGAHSIISQGNLDEILRGKPQDLCELFEETAGVYKYRQRMARSRQKLESYDSNIQRLNDVCAELSRRLQPLERKLKRFQESESLHETLKRLDLSLAADELSFLQKSYDETRAREKTLRSQIQTLELRLHDADEKRRQLNLQLSEQSRSASELELDLRRSAVIVERLGSVELLLSERQSFYERFLKEQTLGSSSAAESLSALQGSLTKLQDELRNEQISVDESLQESEDIEKSLSEALQAYRSSKFNFIQNETRYYTLLREKEQCRTDISALQQKISSTQADARIARERRDELKEEISALNEQTHKDSETLLRTNERLEELLGRESDLQKQCEKLISEREEARIVLEECRHSHAMLTSRLASLEESIRFVHESSQAAMNFTRSAHEKGLNIFDFAELVHPSSELEELVSWAFGELSASYVVDEPNGVFEIVEELRQNPVQGNLSFVCDPARSGQEPGKYFEALGALKQSLPFTFLVEHIRAAEKFQGLLQRFLGKVLLCDNYREAYDIYEKLDESYGCSILSRDGLLIHPDGRFSLCVQFENGKESLFALTRAKDECNKALKVAEGSLLQAQRDFDRCEESFAHIQDESLGLAEKLAYVRGEAHALQESAARSENRLLVLTDSLAKAEKTSLDADSKMQQLSVELSEKIDEEKRFSAEIERCLNDMDRLRNASEQSEHNYTAQQKLSAKAQVKLADARNRFRNAKQNADTAAKEIARLTEDIAHFDSYTSLYGNALTEVEKLRSSMTLLAQCAATLHAGFEEDLGRLKQSFGSLADMSDKALSAYRDEQKLLDESKNQLGELQVDKARYELRVEQAVKVIEQDYKSSLDTAFALLPLSDRAEAEAQARDLRARIARIGVVNADIEEEYKEIKERYDYLSSQLDDLRSAKSGLDILMNDIDSRLQENFDSTFVAVEEKFRDIFSTLFPGGHAALNLVHFDEDDSSGIEVNAQPSGKKITKMTLLSGGEKSLTALALLFALYSIRATPFYLLDEVEAALDDSNLVRLLSYLQSLRSSTQFIMITHQRRTMENADVLFGVSMQNDGVSKVLSQRLSEALAYA